MGFWLIFGVCVGDLLLDYAVFSIFFLGKMIEGGFDL
jgi:hypothetical protein